MKILFLLPYHKELETKSKPSYTHRPNSQFMFDAGFLTFMREYTGFKKSARDGVLGKTAQFWISCMDHIWLVLISSKDQ